MSIVGEHTLGMLIDVCNSGCTGSLKGQLYVSREVEGGRMKGYFREPVLEG